MSHTALLGRPLWYELLTTDMKAAEAFYAAVVGWTTIPFEGASPPYDILHRPDGGAVAGVMAIPDGAEFPPHWEMYIGVPRIEDAVAHIERRGGKALGPLIAVPNVGRMQTMRDPQGAVFAIYEPESLPGPESPAVTGDVVWHELYTTDQAGALQFYGEIFDWRPTDALDMGPMGTYQMFGTSRPLGGMMSRPAAMAHVPSHWNLYFHVPDIDSAVARTIASGGRLLNGPEQVPGGGRIAQCLDPQGAAFALHSRP